MGKILRVKNANLVKKGETVAVNLEGGDVVFINSNLLKNLFEIPYTKKDGTKVTAKDFAAQRAASEARKKERKAT